MRPAVEALSNRRLACYSTDGKSVAGLVRARPGTRFILKYPRLVFVRSRNLSLNLVTVTWNEQDFTQAAASGSITFAPAVNLTDTVDGVNIGTQPRTYFFVNGTGSSDPLVATDNTNLSPSGWTYTVTVALQGVAPYSFNTFIAFANGASQKLSSLVPVSPVPAVLQYLPLTGGTLTGDLNIQENDPVGGLLIVANAHTTPSSPAVQVQAAAAADQAFGIRVSGDAQQRLSIDSNGLMNWGPGGSTAPDTNLSRSGVAALQLGGSLKATRGSGGGRVLAVVNTTSAPTSPTVEFTANAAADQSVGQRVAGDTTYRWQMDSNGSMAWGPGGSSATDTDLSRGGSGLLQTNSGFKAQRVTASGITGAVAASRYVGGTSGGPPTTGTFVAGDFVLDNTGGCWWICTTGGSPGLWEAGGGNDYVTSQQLAAGETTIPRFNAGNSAALVSGTMILTYFTASKTETINTIVGQTATIAAGATPTYAAMGLYSVASNGDLTLVGQCASDTTLFNATFTQFNRAVVTPFTKVAGQRYAFGYLVVSAAAMPNFFGYNGTLFMTGVAPRLNGAVSGQSSLPASVLSASVSGTSQILAGAVTP